MGNRFIKSSDASDAWPKSTPEMEERLMKAAKDGDEDTVHALLDERFVNTDARDWVRGGVWV